MTTINDIAKDNVQLIIDMILKDDYLWEFEWDRVHEVLFLEIFQLETINKNIYKKKLVLHGSLNGGKILKLKKNKFYTFRDKSRDEDYFINLTDHLKKIKKIINGSKIDENGDLVLP